MVTSQSSRFLWSPCDCDQESQMQPAARRRAFFSPSSSNRVFIGLSSALRSNSIGRGKSFAASVPSSASKPQRGKRISIDERRTMVASFVDKYRATNAGRFPKISHVQADIGGSYYIVRQIVQEMMYNSKLAALNKGSVQLGKTEENSQTSDAKELPVSVGNEILKSDNEIEVKTSVPLELEIVSDTTQLPPQGTVACKTEMGAIDPPCEALEQKAVAQTRQYNALETEEHASGRRRTSDQGDSPGTTNLWGNLKMLADGIINFWRR